MKFLADIEVEEGLKDSDGDLGTAGQVLSSTSTGINWIDPSAIVAGSATTVEIECKNTSGSTITKGTPIYQTGTVGATSVIEVAPADALISANKLPAIGLLKTDLINNAFGFVVVTGELLNITTSPIDGLTPTVGDKIFVKSGGGLTLTKPTGEGNGIQNMGLVGKVSGGNAGSITVSSIMRTNDVPNLPTGRTWVGNSNTEVSDTIYIDEPNLRLGIGTAIPSQKLHVSGNARVTGAYYDSNNSAGSNGQVLSSTNSGTTTEWVAAGITGSGTTNVLPKFTASTVLGDSTVFEEGSSTAVSTQQIVDGSFANGSTDWQVGSGSWSVASGKATCNGTNASDPIVLADVLYQVSSAGVSENDSVSISFTISDRTTGTLNLYSYGVESTFVGNGAKTATITSTGNNNFYFYTEDGFDGSVTAISALADVGGFSGGIGVNTTTPRARLDVNGAIRLSDSVDTDDVYAGTLRWAEDLSNTSPSGSKYALQISSGGGWTDVIAFVQDFV